MRNVICKALALAVVVVATVSTAYADPVTLPTTGVDVAGYITALIEALGQVVVIALGGFTAYLLVQMGRLWLVRYLG